MHLLASEAGVVARAAVGLLGAYVQQVASIDRASAERLREAVRGRLRAENDRIGLEALELFEQDPAEYRVPLLIILANKGAQDPGYRAHLQEAVLSAGGQPG